MNTQHPHHVCRLHKSLYGLKQAPCAWFERFTTHLSAVRFHASSTDPSLFVWRTSDYIILLLYVDDIILTGNNPVTINSLIHKFASAFAMKDLGPLHYFLGLVVCRTNGSLFLSQTKYVVDLLKKYKMDGAKPYSSPVINGSKLSILDGDPLFDPSEYHNVVGVSNTSLGPDRILHLRLIKCVNSCTIRLLHIGQQSNEILRYVKWTINHGLLFSKSSSLTLTCFSDADWAGNPDDRRSTIGLCVFIGNNLVSWSAKKQHTVAKSSSESEYRSLAHSAAELSWILYILKDLHILMVHTPIIWCDYVGAFSLASNPIFQAQTKRLTISTYGKSTSQKNLLCASSQQLINWQSSSPKA